MNNQDLNNNQLGQNDNNVVENMEVLDESMFQNQDLNSESLSGIQNSVYNEQNQISNQQVNIMTNNNASNNLQVDQSLSFIKPVETINTQADDLLNAVPKPDMMISSPTDTSISTDDLLSEYIQKNYNKFMKRKFNLSAFFFGSSYMLFRKMYIEGIILSIVLTSAYYLLMILNPFIPLVLNLLISIIFCFIFNKIYVNNVRKKIDKMKSKNKTISANELKKLCKKKGGTNLIVAIILSIIITSLVSATIIQLFPVDSEELVNKIKQNFINNKSQSKTTQEKEDEKNEVLEFNPSSLEYDTDIILSDKLNMQYLTIFSATELSSDAIYDYERLTNQDSIDSYCRFNLSIVKNYESSKKLIKDFANYYNQISTISEISLNNEVTWDEVTIEENGIFTNYASVVNNGSVYLFKYDIEPNANKTLCNAWYVGILKSIEFK